MKTHLWWIAAMVATASVNAAAAQTDDSAPPAVEAEDQSSVTEGSVSIGRNRIDYEATSGLMVMRDDDGNPKTTFGYTAYQKTRVADPAERPILFAYNGGPGSGSMWLHMGILGPRRVVLNDPGHTGPAPYAHVNNEHSVLDVADLVMLDPPGTGFSRLMEGTEPEEYWGVDQDAAVVSKFIARFTTEHGRWRSPKFLLGESYGGMRSGAVAHQLLSAHNLALNGVILVSPFMDSVAGRDGVGIDVAHALFLTTFAATAWYHDLLEDKPDDLRAYLDEVRSFADSDYLLALHKGNRLSTDEKSAIASRLAAYTGTDPDYWLRANLRVAHPQFLQELQRRRGRVTGRADSRYDGIMINPLGERMDYDPYASSVLAAYIATFNDYMTETLQFGRDRTYRGSAGLWRHWDYAHQAPGTSYRTPSAITRIDLEQAMKREPSMRVLVQQGYFDMATPVGATDYFVDHMDLTPEERARIEVAYYEAGHMMYVHDGSIEAYASDLRRFIRDSLPN